MHNDIDWRVRTPPLHNIIIDARNASRQRRRQRRASNILQFSKSDAFEPPPPATRSSASFSNRDPKICIVGRFSEHVPFYDPGSLHERFRIVNSNSVSFCASQIRPSFGDPSWTHSNFRQLLAVGERRCSGYSSRGLVSVYDIDAIETKMSEKGPNLQRVGFSSCVSEPIFSFRAPGRRVTAIQPLVCGMSSPRIFCAFGKGKRATARPLASLHVVKVVECLGTPSPSYLNPNSTSIIAGFETIRTIDVNPLGDRLRSVRVYVGGDGDYGGPGRILAFHAHRPPTTDADLKSCCIFGAGVHQGTIIGLRVDSRKSVLYCAGNDRKISLWSIRDLGEPGDCFDSVELELRPSCLFHVQDKNFLLVGLSRHVAVFDTRKMQQAVRNIRIHGIRRSRTRQSRTRVIQIDRIGCDEFVSVAGDLLTVWNVESGENVRRVELSPFMKKIKPTVYGCTVVGRQDSVEDYELVGREDRERAVFALDFGASSVKLVIGPPFFEFVVRKWMLLCGIGSL